MSTIKSKDKALVPLKNCIDFVESHIFHDRWLMSPATQALMESTLDHLKAYGALLDDKEQQATSSKK